MILIITMICVGYVPNLPKIARFDAFLLTVSDLLQKY